MPNNSRKYLAIATLVVVIGIILMITGVLFGGRKGIYIDMEGVHVMNDYSEEKEVEEFNLTPFKNIDISVGSQKVEVLYGDSYGIEMKNTKHENLEWSNDAGTLRVSSKFRLSFNFLFFPALQESYIKVYIPYDAKLDDTDIRIGSGSATMDGIESKSLSYNIASGKAFINNSTVGDLDLYIASGNVHLTDSEFDSMKVKVSSGKLGAKGISSNGSDINVTSGRANFEGKLLGKTKVHVTSGNVSLDLAGKSEDYRKNINVTSGGVRVDGVKTKGYQDSNNNAPNKMDISVTSGNVELNFR